MRFWLMAAILALECVPVTMARHPWLRARTTASSVIFFGVALLFFGRDKLKAVRWDVSPVDRRWTALHACALALFFLCNVLLLWPLHTHPPARLVLLVLWYCALAAVPLTLAAAMFHPRQLLRILRSLGDAWGLAASLGALTMLVRALLLVAWDQPDSIIGSAIQGAAFRGVKTVLSLFCADVQSDPAASVIGTKNFLVQIAGVCSGIEGLALMLSLTVGWLFYSRRELRLLRSMMLVPASLAMVWLLNLVRIAALIAIGNSGHEAIAEGGFHSEAGWIFFSCVALAFLLAVNRIAWFHKPAAAGAPAHVGGRLLAETNPAAVYLGPLLAIIAAGLISTAASDGFERFYGLRFAAVAAVLFAYRRSYSRIDWRFGWPGPLAGLAVFAMWIGLSRIAAPVSASHSPLTTIAAGLSHLDAFNRVAWLAIRVLTSVIAIPIAEELAFRGYIARRLTSADVDSVSMRNLSFAAILGSSLAFGMVHGRMWPAGILAGLAFAAVAKLRGRLGEAVAAHATANLAIAIWVLARGDYSFW
jgi:exosortase E/protease (VPEID-CTERM system)